MKLPTWLRYILCDIRDWLCNVLDRDMKGK